MKKYRVLFFAGDAILARKDYYLPAEFNEAAIILTLMEKRESLQEEYGCPVSLRVYFAEEFPSVTQEIQSRHYWWNWVTCRISSFFNF